jgi:DUF4097 and DUF4098 domain-containing protein YvlB
MLRNLYTTAAIVAALATAGSAQTRDRDSTRAGGDAGCAEQQRNNRPTFCEEREATIGGANPIDIDAGNNGGIRVHGWDRGDVLVKARVSASAATEADARRLVAGVHVDTSGGSVRADGPQTSGRDESWSVSFDVQVPRAAMLTLNTHNGGISIEGFHGSARFHATNGGVTLNSVDGDLKGETTNGGVTVDLVGDHWNGTGLDVQTRNGGIRLTLPAGYSAELETGTTNGGFNVDFPITVQGRIDRILTATLGSGGPKLRAMTTNGGVTIRQR